VKPLRIGEGDPERRAPRDHPVGCRVSTFWQPLIKGKTGRAKRVDTNIPLFEKVPQILADTHSGCAFLYRAAHAFGLICEMRMT
jgi:hypothetical protein